MVLMMLQKTDPSLEAVKKEAYADHITSNGTQLYW